MRDKTKLGFRSARLVRRAGALHLVMPRAVWKQVGIGVGDAVEIQYSNGCVVFTRGKRSARIRKVKKTKRSMSGAGRRRR
jgi:antitoxin component of MazEF toxin-antitoxin module